jgi:hypothetical protein
VKDFRGEGMGSLTLLPRDLDPTLAHETELKLSRSLSLPSIPLSSGASGEYVFLTSVTAVPTVGGPLRALTCIVKVGRGPCSSLGACLIGIAVALLMQSCIVSVWCCPHPPGGSFVCPCSDAGCASSSMSSSPPI